MINDATAIVWFLENYSASGKNSFSRHFLEQLHSSVLTHGLTYDDQNCECNARRASGIAWVSLFVWQRCCLNFFQIFQMIDLCVASMYLIGWFRSTYYYLYISAEPAGSGSRWNWKNECTGNSLIQTTCFAHLSIIFAPAPTFPS